VCDEFFVPAIEACSRRFAIPEDVAGATLMAFGCNGPELFVNGVSIFVTHSDVGVGTIVGSEIFNLLCIIGGAALVAPVTPMPVDKVPFIRDATFYALAALLLALTVRDGRVERVEALSLVAMAGVYAFAVSNTAALVARAGWAPTEMGPTEPALTDTAQAELQAREGATRLALEQLGAGSSGDAGAAALVTTPPVSAGAASPHAQHHDDPAPTMGSLKQASALLDASLRPFEHLLAATVPDCRAATAETDERWPAAFAVSMAWLALCSLAVCLTADQLTVDFGIPSSVIGLTIAAAGTSFANLVSSLIESRRGRMGMAVSNAFGSNVQNVFLALGIPWAAYCLLAPAGGALEISAAGISQGLFFMLGTLVVFCGFTVAADFRVSKALARGAIVTYAGYIALTCAPLLLGVSP
jgi:K+-dependent Na+/Ca+ exchanger-like protein